MSDQAAGHPHTHNGGFNARWLLIPLVVLAALTILWVAGAWSGSNQPYKTSAGTGFDDTPTPVPASATPVVVVATPVPAQPTAQVIVVTATPPAQQPTMVAQTQPPAVVQTSGACVALAPITDLDSMPKLPIEQFQQGVWTHRVFQPDWFKAPDWNGADSWFVTLNAMGWSGGNWTSFRNPGQIIFRGTDRHITWCLGVLTTSKWKSQFMAGSSAPFAAINVRIIPNSIVTVVTKSGRTVRQATSDAGDITIVLPDDGVTTISVDYTTQAPTHESHVWWGPYDRSSNINTIDARQ